MIHSDLKSGDPIFSTKLGDGYVLSINWKKSYQLLMCYFPSKKEYHFITTKEIRRDPSISFEPFEIDEKYMKKNVRKEFKTFPHKDF